MRDRIVSALVGFLLGVSCNASLTRSGDVSEEIRTEWGIGQGRAFQVAGDVVYGVHPEMFRIEAMPGPFMCGDELAQGCYSSSSRRIRYNRETPSAVRHEAGHAILHVLGWDCWRRFEHEDFPYGCHP